MTTPTIPSGGASAEAVAAARLLLSQMGISPADLISGGPVTPTFGALIPKVRTTLTEGTLATYDTHFKRLEAGWSDRHLDQVSKADLEA